MFVLSLTKKKESKLKEKLSITVKEKDQWKYTFRLARAQEEYFKKVFLNTKEEISYEYTETQCT